MRGSGRALEGLQSAFKTCELTPPAGVGQGAVTAVPLRTARMTSVMAVTEAG
jgi:hypothetical protein